MTATEGPATNIATLPFLPHADIDYPKRFRRFAAVQAAIARRGNQSDLVLERGRASLALGNYLAAVFDAERVLRAGPNVDAFRLKGQGCLALAAVKQGIARPGVGTYLPPQILPRRKHLLLTARECFREVLAMQPEDEETRKSLVAADEFLAALEDLAAVKDAPAVP